MHFTGARKYKKFRECVPGELVAFEIHLEMSLGIVVDVNETFGTLAALIDKHEGHPRLLQLDADEDFISYGSDWVIEPFEGKQSFPWSHELNKRSGLLALTDKGWLINLADSSVDQVGRFTHRWFNLDTLKMNPNPTRQAFYDHWKLWASEADRSGGKGKPLFEIHVEPREIQL